ncbi:MAG TPA: hypothetical protein VGI74_06820 [Streptosporangiaceae bacterium]|jgi:hypothetical protein
MGRLILTLVGVIVAVMLVVWIVAKLVALFWIALIVLVGFGVMKLAFSAGRRSRRE